jgi:hypothetical protein
MARDLKPGWQSAKVEIHEGPKPIKPGATRGKLFSWYSCVCSIVHPRVATTCSSMELDMPVPCNLFGAIPNTVMLCLRVNSRASCSVMMCEAALLVHFGQGHEEIGLGWHGLWGAVRAGGEAFGLRYNHCPNNVFWPVLAGLAIRFAPRKVGWEALACGFWPWVVAEPERTVAARHDR